MIVRSESSFIVRIVVSSIDADREARNHSRPENLRNFRIATSVSCAPIYILFSNVAITGIFARMRIIVRQLQCAFAHFSATEENAPHYLSVHTAMFRGRDTFLDRAPRRTQEGFNAPDESASRVHSPRAPHNYVSMLYGSDVTKARGRLAAFRHCKLKLRKCATRVVIAERAR